MELPQPFFKDLHLMINTLKKMVVTGQSMAVPQDLHLSENLTRMDMDGTTTTIFQSFTFDD